MKVRIGGVEQSEPRSMQVKVACPHCGHLATLDPLQGFADLHTLESAGGIMSNLLILGQRVCPDTQCRGHVFFVARSERGKSARVVALYPGLEIALDEKNLPSRLVAALKEAIRSHAAECYAGSAMLVRKTLEVLCEERGVTGGDLKERLTKLSETIILPKDLVEGFTHVRLLGNDAAHVEARTYDDIGPEEVAVAIEFTKEVLKACYQYSDLIARMRPRGTGA